MLKKIKQIKPLVKRLLTDYPHLRDSDEKLIANLWHRQIGVPANFSAAAFLRWYAEGKLINPESIRRSRQWLQEHHPELRGKKYNDRHAESEKMRQAVVDNQLFIEQDVDQTQADGLSKMFDKLQNDD